MAHINKLIDYTVVVYIVYNGKVLLVNHKQLKKWLPIGGHIELDEDPVQAALREAKEESGLEIEIIAEKPEVNDPDNKILHTPEYLDIHRIDDIHRHVGIIYFARADNDKITLAEKEHNNIKWFSKAEIEAGEVNLRPAIKFYAYRALDKLG
jgi:8-oxo-dGTP diphosphatase